MSRRFALRNASETNRRRLALKTVDLNNNYVFF